MSALKISNVFNNIFSCGINAAISYGSDNSTLNFAIWLPDILHYDGRFMAVGDGTIDSANMLIQFNSGLGCTVAGGDAGHLALANNMGEGAPGVYLPYLHDEAQVTAWIHDAINLFTSAVKALPAAFYGKAVLYDWRCAGRCACAVPLRVV